MYYVDVKKLQSRIVECGTTQEALAAELGIDRSTLRRRINSGRLQIKDIHKMCEVLSLKSCDALAIFLCEKSHKCS